MQADSRLRSADVFANLNDGDDSNNPMILDMRSADEPLRSATSPARSTSA